MKIELNSDFVKKVRKQLAKENENESKRRRFKKRNINKNYFILLGIMVLLVGTNIARNVRINQVSEISMPVFSNSDEANEKKSDIKSSSKKLNLSSFTLPVLKDKILSYNYANGTMNIQIEKGESIFSMTDGIVENTYLDYSYGYTIVIKTDEGAICKYSNVDGNFLVNIGDRITKGQNIGKTLDYALLDASYIYISVTKNGENINIAEIFDSIK